MLAGICNALYILPRYFAASEAAAAAMAERDKVWDLYAGDAHNYNESVDVWYGDEGQHKSLHG